MRGACKNCGNATAWPDGSIGARAKLGFCGPCFKNSGVGMHGEPKRQPFDKIRSIYDGPETRSADDTYEDQDTALEDDYSEDSSA